MPDKPLAIPRDDAAIAPPKRVIRRTHRVVTDPALINCGLDVKRAGFRMHREVSDGGEEMPIGLDPGVDEYIDPVQRRATPGFVRNHVHMAGGDQDHECHGYYKPKVLHASPPFMFVR